MQGTIIAKRCHFQPLCLRSYQRPWRFPCQQWKTWSDLVNVNTQLQMMTMMASQRLKILFLTFWYPPSDSHTLWIAMRGSGILLSMPYHCLCCCLLYLCKRCQAGSWGGWQMWVFDIRPCQASATRRNFGQEIWQRKEFQTWSFTWS